MASYRLEWRRSTRKDLRRIPPVDVAKIIAAAELLANDPFPTGCVKLTGSERSYRVRVGNYRILYDVFNARLVVEVIKIGRRKEVYRD